MHQGDKDRSGAAHSVFEVPNVVLHLNKSSVHNLSTTPTGEAETEAYPTHNIVPVMIYIGGETRDYYEYIYEQYH